MREVTASIQDAYDLLELIRKEHWAMLDAPTLSNLHSAWLSVTALCRLKLVPLDMGSPDFRHFGHWLAARAGDGLHSGGWPYFTRIGRTDEEAFQFFFEELDLFRTRSLRVLASTRVPDDGNPVPALQIVAYEPEDAHFIRVIEPGVPPRLEWAWTRARAESTAAARWGTKTEDWAS